MYKLIIFVPKISIEKFKDDIFSAGAGSLGNYSACSFETEGIGQFKPNEQANPTIGERGSIEKVKEIKLEVLVQNSDIESVLKSLYLSHPYEEPAFDLIKLENNKFEHLKPK